jgi:AcrR family transcriptional regulator
MRQDNEKTRKRAYRMGARAEAAEQTRERILAAARDLFMAASFDDVTLERIAERAGVALKTVQRRFRSKDELLLACSELEADHRNVTPGDLDAIVRVLASRYEASMDAVVRYLPLELRVPAIAGVFEQARRGHWRWLDQAFAPLLPAEHGALRRRRVAELFVATEIYAWHALRRRFGLGPRLVEEVLRETLDSLIARWKTQSTSARGDTDE